MANNNSITLTSLTSKKPDFKARETHLHSIHLTKQDLTTVKSFIRVYSPLLSGYREKVHINIGRNEKKTRDCK